MRAINYILFLCVVVAHGQVSFSGNGGLSGSVSVNNAPASGGYSYIYQQDFESGSIPSGWTTVGTVNYGYNTSPAPLVGNFSLEMANGNDAYYSPLGQITEVWTFCLCNLNDSGSRVFTLTDQFDTSLLNVDISGTELEVDDSTASAFTSGAGFSLGTTIRLWAHYKAGTGANATLELWWNTTDTQLTDSAHHAITNVGVNTTGVDRIRCAASFGSAGQINIFDKLRASTSLIGSNPN